MLSSDELPRNWCKCCWSAQGDSSEREWGDHLRPEAASARPVEAICGPIPSEVGRAIRPHPHQP